MARFELLPKFIQRDVQRLYEGGVTVYYIAKALHHFGVTEFNVDFWAKKYGWERKEKKLTKKQIKEILSYAFINLDDKALDKLRTNKSILRDFKIVPPEKFEKKLTVEELRKQIERFEKKVAKRESTHIKHKKLEKDKKVQDVKRELIENRAKTITPDSAVLNPTYNVSTRDKRADPTIAESENPREEVEENVLKVEVETIDHNKKIDKTDEPMQDSGIIFVDDKLDEVVYKVIQSLLSGAREYIIKKALKRDYGFSLKRTKEIIELAKVEIQKSIEINALYAMAFHREARLFLYNKMVKNDDLRGALEVLKDLGKLDGIYPKETIAEPILVDSNKEDDVIIPLIPDEYKQYFEDNQEKGE